MIPCTCSLAAAQRQRLGNRAGPRLAQQKAAGAAALFGLAFAEVAALLVQSHSSTLCSPAATTWRRSRARSATILQLLLLHVPPIQPSLRVSPLSIPTNCSPAATTWQRSWARSAWRAATSCCAAFPRRQAPTSGAPTDAAAAARPLNRVPLRAAGKACTWLLCCGWQPSLS